MATGVVVQLTTTELPKSFIVKLPVVIMVVVGGVVTVVGIWLGRMDLD